MELLITTLFSGTFSEMNNKIASSNWYIDPIVVQSDIVLKESLETIYIIYNIWLLCFECIR